METVLLGNGLDCGMCIRNLDTDPLVVQPID